MADVPFEFRWGSLPDTTELKPLVRAVSAAFRQLVNDYESRIVFSDSHARTISVLTTFSAGLTATSPTVGIGYGVGAGGAVTQVTDKATGVTLSKVTGQITLNNAALAADTTVSFTLTNTAIAVTDLVLINHVSAGTAGSYLVNAQAAAGSAVINVRNITAGSLSEAIVLGYVVIKGAIT